MTATETSDRKKAGTRPGAGEFRFKRFSVRNEKSAMKVNTDGVILGAAMTLTGEERQILDIGTGTGTIALMAAQRLSDIRRAKESNKCEDRLQTNEDDGIPLTYSGSTDSGQGGGTCERHGIMDNIDFIITGIDIDRDSAEEAAVNFRRSEWSRHLKAAHIPLEEYAASLPSGTSFGLICSNPPYYSGDLKAPDIRRCKARHSGSMSWKDITDFAMKFLSDKGRLSLIIPADQEKELIRNAAAEGLHAARILRIRTVPGKPHKRTVAEFMRCRPANVDEDMLTIQEGGACTPEYKSLLSDFLLDF